MRYALTLSLAASLAVCGCVSPQSSTWSTVRASRLEFRAESSEAYAEHLSATLKAARVSHKVVRYEYQYRTPGGDQAIATRTAVLYRDGDDPRNPWWLMEDRLRAPVWVPGEDPEYQVSFYLHRPATVTAVNGRSFADGKRVVAGRSIQTLGLPLARFAPVRPGERSRKHSWVQRGEESSAITARQLVAFRLRHGSKFDPSSVADRLKMERLIKGNGASVAGR